MNFSMTKTGIDAMEIGGGYEHFPQHVKDHIKRGSFKMRHYKDTSTLMIGYTPDGTEFACIFSDLEVSHLDEELFTI